MFNEKDMEKCRTAFKDIPSVRESINKLSLSMITISECHDLDLDDVFNEMIIYIKADLMNKKESGEEDRIRKDFSDFASILDAIFLKK